MVFLALCLSIAAAVPAAAPPVGAPVAPVAGGYASEEALRRYVDAAISASPSRSGFLAGEEAPRLPPGGPRLKTPRPLQGLPVARSQQSTKRR